MTLKNRHLVGIISCKGYRGRDKKREGVNFFNNFWKCKQCSRRLYTFVELFSTTCLFFIILLFVRFAWRRAAGEFISVHSSVWVGAGNLNAVDIICLGQSRKLLCRRYNLSGPEYETFKP